MFGETRTVTHFAFIPIRMRDGTWCVWKHYEAVERLEPDESGWSAGRWIEIERRRGDPKPRRSR